tara:strand:- start:1596 stop:2900 length:1305 start_codon:yes stop_codon:yes gene_type:complete
MYDVPIARPRPGQEIIFTDGTTREFAGVIIDIDRTMGEGNRLTRYSFQCMDYSYYLDRRYINKLYSKQASDEMISEIIDDLVAAAILDDIDGIGDGHYNDFNTNDTTPHTIDTPINNGHVINQQRFERVLPSQAFDLIAEASGMYWWIDFNKAVNFSDIRKVQAPLPEVDGIAVLKVDTDNTNFYGLIFGESIEGVGTKVVLRDTLIKSTATLKETFTVVGAPPTEGVTFLLKRRPFSELDFVSIIRTRGTLTFTPVLEDITDPTAGQDEVAIYVGPRRGGSEAYIRFLASDLQDTDVITVIYNYSISDDHESIDPEKIEPIADLTSGDGIHEYVFTQANELAVSNIELLDDISDIILARKSQLLLRGQFRSLKKGWVAGQSFTFSWAKEDINETMYVINLTKSVLTPADDPNLVDNVIESVVHFSNMPRGMRL